MSGSDDETLQSTLTWADSAPSSAPGVPPDGSDRDRYVLLGPIGRGGMGEVLRVHDQRLDATVAMKVLSTRLADSDRAQERFLHEARITAQLRHPGIVSVHDRGTLEDGRPWFTMTEVRGRTLQAVIEATHAKPDPTALRGLVDMIRRAAEAVAYAHRHGVIHRDLKPANVMVGEFGEVCVMDWGLARRLDLPEDLESDITQDTVRTLETRYGDVVGTPAFMPIEQAQGDTERIDATADVYALGAVLYTALCGSPPYRGDSMMAMSALLGGPPPPLASRASPELPIPAELIQACERAMARNPAARYPDASGLVRALTDWLDGAARLEEAQIAVARAAQMRPEIEALTERATQLRSDAGDLLEHVRPNDPVARKRTAWMLLDQAEELETQAAFQEAIWLQTLRSALNRVADFAPAHRALGEHYKARLLEVEQKGSRADAARLETQLRAHNLGEHTAFLDGRAWITLHTAPSGAAASLYRYVERDRRSELQFVRDLGPTPLREVELTHGSYVIRLDHRGHATVSYPFRVGRLEHWDGIRPGANAPHPIALPPAGALGSATYVPAGWTPIGGDPDALDALPATRVWIDAFLIQTEPVTYGAYLAYLDDLARLQGIEAAVAVAPRIAGAPGRALLVEQKNGRFALTPGSDEVQLLPEWPLESVSWHEARGYARWVSGKQGRSWDLPSELAWEKAARGVDGRPLPWGRHFDATWANMVEHYEPPRRARSSEHPLDCSPYGVLGMAGGVRDWCLDVWRSGGPPVRDGILVADVDPGTGPDFRVARGGNWHAVRGGVRSAARFGGPPDQRFGGVGFRLARWLGADPNGRVVW